MPIISRIVGGGIGLASEAVAAVKKPKSSEALKIPPELQQTHDHTQADNRQIGMEERMDAEYDDTDAQDYDEHDWQMDDTQTDAGTSHGQSFEQSYGVDDVVTTFLQKHPLPSYGEATRGDLPRPVIIPQRRPGSKTRGWVHAYAPDLQPCGIDQTTFMDFLDGFEKAIKLSPVFNVVQLGVFTADKIVLFTAGFVPPMIIFAHAAHISIEASRRTYMNVQNNKYLDQMNEKLFKPKGLFAMIVTYKPASKQSIESIDLSSKIIKTVAERDSGKTEHFYSSAAGTTRSEYELPDVAPLVFPRLEALPEDQKQNAFQRFGKSMQDYSDRKARAQFAAANPTNTQLNVEPPPQFANRYSDPNSAARTGGLIGLATGGNRLSRRSQRQGLIRSAVNGIRGTSNTTNPAGPTTDAYGKTLPKYRRQGRSIMGRVLGENTLYLTIVNLPTEQEIKEALSQIEAANHTAEENTAAHDSRGLNAPPY